jgi:hypothetical protein
MGKISDTSDEVFKISLPSENVETSDAEDMAVHSGFDYPKMKEVYVGEVNYTVPNPLATGTFTIKTVTHNLGYKPMIQCFVEDVDGVFNTDFAILPYFIDIGFSGSNEFRCYSTTTQLKIEMIILFTMGSKLSGGEEFNFKYQIWVND